MINVSIHESIISGFVERFYCLNREFKINDATTATTLQNLHAEVTKTKVLHALHVLFLIPCISFKFSANLRREMTISQVLQRT